MERTLASHIDHTALKAGTTEAQIRTLCEEAVTHNFASVCVNPTWVSLCWRMLDGTDVKVCTVIGFPLGANLSQVKATEATCADVEGADEFDMVINIGALKDSNHDLVLYDVQLVREAAPDKVLKVIIETDLLTDEEKVIACELAKKAGADFVKTSTGFLTGGATVEDVALMRQTVGPDMGVKASGGIRNAETAKAMIEAGATRLGCSAGVDIVTA